LKIESLIYTIISFHHQAKSHNDIVVAEITKDNFDKVSNPMLGDCFA